MNAPLPRAMIGTAALSLLLAGTLAPTRAQQDEPAATAPVEAIAPQTPSSPVYPFAPPPLPADPKVALIRIEGMVYDFTLDSLQRRIQRARDQGANYLVLEMDTYGGVVTSALEISKYLKSLDIPTVAWVNDKAYSAGILVSSSCNAIVMSPTGTTGDCAPIVPGMELATTERAKALTPILTEFEDNAKRNGYHYELLHAMVEWGIEVYEVQHKTTGRRTMVNQVDYQVMVKGVDPENAGKPGILGGFWQRDEGTAIGLGLSQATEADKGRWELVRLVHNGKTLLTVNAERAKDIGLARADDIRTERDLQRWLGVDSLIPIDQSWSEDLAGWLTHPMVRGALVLALLLGAYMEMQAPGVGFPGAVALCALILLLVPPFIIGLAEVWHVIAIVLGVVLLGVELLVLPGFGVAGFSGLALIFIGLVFMVVPTQPGSGGGVMPLPSPEMWGRVGMSLLSVLAGLILSTVGFAYINKYFGRIPGLNRLILAGASASNTVAGPILTGNPPELHVHVGDVGLAVTDLRPAGRAQFDSYIVDVATPGLWIRADQAVRIVDIQGNRIVVDEVSEE